MNNLDISKILEAGAAAAMSIEQIIEKEIQDFLSSGKRRRMLVSQRYYVGEHEILNRKRLVIGEDGRLVEDRNLANHKLVHLFVRKLVDQKVGYLLSKPLSIQTDNEAYHEALSQFFNKKFLRLLKSVGKEAIKKGIGWIQVFYNEQGELSFKRIPSEEVMPLWKDAEHTELDALIRVYNVETYEGTTKKIITKVEFWDQEGVRRYIMGSRDYTPNTGSSLIPDIESVFAYNGHFVIEDEDGGTTPYKWDRIPFIAFKYNDDELPIIENVKSLVDDYDLLTSDNSNNISDTPNGIYVLTNFDGEDLGEFRRNISTYRAVKLRKEGSLDTITIDINSEALTKHIEQLRKDIFESGRGVDTQSEKFGNSPSGIALKFLYADLDMDANDIETEFQASLEQLRWFIDVHLINNGLGDFTNEQVEFIFNRDILINETDTISNLKDSAGMISDETRVSNHPYVQDPKKELERIKAEKKADMEEYGGLPGPGDPQPPKQPPAGGADDE
ncbi:phage portal protein [Paenibacillus elgii]|uniref:phage portal protein n=1 Tax=Paenibacillus elgii TaxID=189691 RepID=UPI00203FEF08|nr:phage portal protein [Paenibacillus elgii]